MGVCCVIGCKSRSKERRMPHRAQEGITFHAFPSKNLALRAKWIIAIRGEGWVPNKHAKVCSKHFEERLFDRSGHTNRLKENAMPTRGLDPARLWAALKTEPKMEYMEPAHVVEPAAVEALVGHVGHPSYQAHPPYVNVNVPSFSCEDHDNVLSPDECNKLMYALDLGDGRKIKLIYSVPKGQCITLF